MIAGLPEREAGGRIMLNRTNVVEENKKEENLDEEWVELMRRAYKMGISIEEVKRFIAYNKPS